MHRKLATRSSVFAIALLALALPAVAVAAAPGGLGARGQVDLDDVVCLKRCVGTHEATPGALIKVRGQGMDEITHVVFRGPGGPIQVEPRRTSERVAVALVPADAQAGRLFVIDTGGGKSTRSQHKLFILPRAAIPPSAHPVQGRYQFWDGFGGARRHQGVDLGARCGTPLVAAQPGRVSWKKFQGRAGHYVGIDLEASDAEILYMHLRGPSPLRVGQLVETGQTVGYVGASGNASGCHLHFEYWVGKAWRGGEAVDPQPYLSQWKAEERAARKARKAGRV